MNKRFKWVSEGHTGDAAEIECEKCRGQGWLSVPDSPQEGK